MADGAVERPDARCRRAEEEYPHLAAPDGTVAVPFVDLRAALDHITTLEAEIEGLREALEEARLIVANLPHGERMLLAKIDSALKGHKG